MPKIEPAIMTFQFPLVAAAGQYQYIDLMKCASLLNRRAYSQGMNVAVAGFTLFTSTAQTIQIERIPNTWVSAASWVKTKNSWERQQIEALEDGDQESVRSKYADFKIYFDEAHHAAGDLLPVSVPAAGAGTHAEWDHSQIVIPNFGAPGVNYEPYLHMIGPDVGGVGGSLGLIRGYANSRSVPQSPDPTTPTGVRSTDNWLNLMFDVGDNNTLVIGNATTKNDELPYDQINYFGEDFFNTEVVDLLKVSATTVGGITRGRGGNFPCGLIKLNMSEAEGDAVLLVHMVPGPARGYMAEPMEEMN